MPKDWTRGDELSNELFIPIDRILAEFVDVNDDGVDEVVGFCCAAIYDTQYGYVLFVLEKTKSGYVDRVSFVASHYHILKILKTFNNGYRDIEAVTKKDEKVKFQYSKIGHGYTFSNCIKGADRNANKNYVCPNKQC